MLDLTDDEGVDLCLDSVGAETFEDSVRCTHILGTVGLFGVASGQPEPVHLMLQDLETARKFVRPHLCLHQSYGTTSGVSAKRSRYW